MCELYVAILSPQLTVLSPRKVDSMIKPFGYHYEKGRVYVLEGKKAGSATDTKDDGAKNEEVDKKPKPAKEIAASKGKKRSSSPEQDEKVVNKKAKKALTKKEIKAQEQAQKKDEEDAKTVKAEAAAEEVDKQVEKDVEEIKKENSCSDEDGQDDEE